MKVKNIMTKHPVALKQSDSLETVLKVLAKNKISGCPIINSKRQVIGIISETDILNLIDVYSSIKKSESLPLLLGILVSGESFENVKKSLKKILDLPVRDFMVKKVITIDEDDDVYKAARLMNKHGINRLPVVKNDKLVGIITRADIVKALEKIK